MPCACKMSRASPKRLHERTHAHEHTDAHGRAYAHTLAHVHLFGCEHRHAGGDVAHKDMDAHRCKLAFQSFI